MQWPGIFLYNAAWLIEIGAAVIILYYVFPAYKRTRHVGLLLLSFSSAIWAFDTICDHTIGQTPMTGLAYYGYRALRYSTYIAETILYTVGVLLLLRSFLRMKGFGGLQTAFDETGKIEVCQSVTCPSCGRTTVTCPSCGGIWELSPEEEAKKEFACTDCGKTFALRKE